MNPWPRQYQCSALSTVLTRQLGAGHYEFLRVRLFIKILECQMLRFIWVIKIHLFCGQLFFSCKICCPLLSVIHNSLLGLSSWQFVFNIQNHLCIQNCQLLTRKNRGAYLSKSVRQNPKIQIKRSVAVKLITTNVKQINKALNPMSDHDGISPYHINTISSWQVMRLKNNIN